MDSIDFGFLYLQFSKCHDKLVQNGFNVYLEPNDNFFRDSLIISRHDGYKSYYFVIEHLNWDRYKEFSISTRLTGSYVYRFNLITGFPYLVRSQPLGMYLSTQLEMPDDVRHFGELVLKMLSEISQKTLSDKMGAG